MAITEEVLRTWSRGEAPVGAPQRAAGETSPVERPDVSVVMPAFNEEPGIRGQLVAITEALGDTAWRFEVLVVDDGSEDGTVEQAQGLPGVTVIQHGANRGYGAALKTGIRRARGEYVVITDADGTYPASEIPRLLEQLDGCDMAVGARTGEEVKIPFFRKPAKWVLRKLAEFLAETKIPDLNSGLRVFRKGEVVRYLPILCSGFSFTTTITLAMLCTDRIVRYVPINYHARRGRSKIRPFRDTYNFLLLVLRTICYFNPLKVFMPPALVLFGLGAAKLAYSLVTASDVYDSELLFLVSGLQLGALGLIADAVAKSRLLPSEERAAGAPQ